MSVYMTDFLHKQRGMTVERATVVAVVFGVGTTVGQLGGAKVGQSLYNRRAALQPLFMGVGTARACSCLVVVCCVPTKEYTW